MTEFKKGYRNLAELEIQEWIEPKQKGFMKFDVVQCKKDIKSRMRKLGLDYRTKQCIEIVNNSFGDLEEKEE